MLFFLMVQTINFLAAAFFIKNRPDNQLSSEVNVSRICDPGPRNLAIKRSGAQLASIMHQISQPDLTGALKFTGIRLLRFYTLNTDCPAFFTSLFARVPHVLTNKSIF